MASDLASLRRDRARASDRMNELATASRGRSMTDDEQRDFDAAHTEVKSLDGKITAAEATTTSTSSIGRADASEIARLCVDGGVPSMTATLLAEGATVEDAKKRIATAGEAEQIVALARRKEPSIASDLATKMLTDGKSVEQIRAACFDQIVAKEKEQPVSSHVPALQGNAGAAASKSNMQRQLEAQGLVKKEA